MIFEIGNYQIRPYGNNLCWEIYEYRDVTCHRGENKGKTSKKWVSMERYPLKFGHALEVVYELMLKNCDEVITGLPDAINTAKKISDDIFNAKAKKERIVRCADCKYAGTNDCVLDVHVPFKQDGFCSWGEER